MSHKVLSLKYRPQGFDELVGQEHVARILTGALTSSRVGHAYLFVGPRGVGKTTTARIFAKALNCAEAEGEAGTPEPCGTCVSCHDIAAGIDLDVVEMDAASNNHVEDVRRLREQVGYATVRSRFRIWIVDEVHMLSMPAFNAFLKTLEEPPERVKFLFCTTEEQKLPDTFRSRCQRVEFRPIDASLMAARLRRLAEREGVEVEEGLCEEIASAALGGLRDAESLLEQLIAATPSEVLRRVDLDQLAGRAPQALLEGLLEAVDARDAGAALDQLDLCLASGCKPGVLLDQWMDALRRRLLERARRPKEGEGGVAPLARALDVLLEKRAHLKAGADGTLVCQVAAVELARLPDARDLDQLLAALPEPETTEPSPTPPSRRTPSSASPPAPDAPPAPPPAPPRAAPRRAPPSDDVTRPTDPAARAAVTPALLARRWPDLVAAAARTDGRLGEALRRARPVDVAEGVVGLAVASHDLLTRSALERREAVLAFRRIAREVVGQELAPRVEVDETAPAPASEVRDVPQQNPAVRLVTEATGGRLLDVEKPPSTGNP